MNPKGIPDNFIEVSPGNWAHPSRVVNGPVAQMVEQGATQSGRNPEVGGKATGSTPVRSTKPPRRIRQSTKPLMNKLEQKCLDFLSTQGKKLYPQAITFRLANGVRFTPDIFCWEWIWQNEPRPTAWEVKGPWFTDDAKVKIKLFAAAYPEIVVLLVSEDKMTGQWHFQIVYP